MAKCFSIEGALILGEGQYTILPKFPQNGMKLKEFGPRGASFTPPRSPSAMGSQFWSLKTWDLNLHWKTE